MGKFFNSLQSERAIWEELPDAAMLTDASSGSFRSSELLRRPVSVRMTGVCGMDDIEIWSGISMATAKRQQSRSFTARPHQRLDLGIQDGMSLGWQPSVLRLAIGRLASLSGFHH